MELNEIRQLASLMKEMGLTALEYCEGDSRVRLERSCSQAPMQPRPAEDPSEDVSPAKEEAGDGIYTVTSPMVGVFYAAPGPDKKPFVSVGDRVNVGDVLCIIEAMKMMNEITAEKSGVIVEVCVGNKQVVDYGHPLFRIRVD